MKTNIPSNKADNIGASLFSLFLNTSGPRIDIKSSRKVGYCAVLPLGYHFIKDCGIQAYQLAKQNDAGDTARKSLNSL